MNKGEKSTPIIYYKILEKRDDVGSLVIHLDNVKLFMGDETGRIGRLGEVLARHQKGVLLFDEIEKAHRLIWDLFLQMLDAARVTLVDHRTYNLSGFYMVCTSNIGSPAASPTNPVAVHCA